MKNRYALTWWRSGKTTAKIVISPDFDGDWHKRYFPKYNAKSIESVNGFRLMSGDTSNGIPFAWELSGSSGARFWLFPPNGLSKREIQKAKNQLKRNRDVTGITVCPVEESEGTQ